MADDLKLEQLTALPGAIGVADLLYVFRSGTAPEDFKATGQQVVDLIAAIVAAAVAGKANLASPALTGTPTAPTIADPLDASTKLANSQFVQDRITLLSELFVSFSVLGSGGWLGRIDEVWSFNSTNSIRFVGAELIDVFRPGMRITISSASQNFFGYVTAFEYTGGANIATVKLAEGDLIDEPIASVGLSTLNAPVSFPPAFTYAPTPGDYDDSQRIAPTKWVQAEVLRILAANGLDAIYSYVNQTFISRAILLYGWLDIDPVGLEYVSPTEFKGLGAYPTHPYKVGDKLQIVQAATPRFFYVVGTTYDGGTGETTIKVAAGSDYVLVNSSLQAVMIGIGGAQYDFPEWFNFAPTFTGFATPPTGAARFRLDGRTVTVAISQSSAGAGVSNAIDFTISLPVAPAKTVADLEWWNAALAVDNGAFASNAMFQIVSGGSVINAMINGDGAAWTNSGAKRASGSISYEI